MSNQSCACKSSDAFTCFQIRYRMHDATTAEIQRAGGPCECACHRTEPIYDDGWSDDHEL